MFIASKIESMYTVQQMEFSADYAASIYSPEPPCRVVLAWSDKVFMKYATYPHQNGWNYLTPWVNMLCV